MCIVIARTWSRQVSIAAWIIDLNRVQLDPKSGSKFQSRILDPTEAQNPKFPTQTSSVLG